MVQRMALLRSQGHTEQSSPELASLATMFGHIQRQLAKLRQMQLAQPGQSQMSPQSNQSQGVPLPSNGPIPLQQPSSASGTQVNGNTPGSSQIPTHFAAQTAQGMHIVVVEC